MRSYDDAKADAIRRAKASFIRRFGPSVMPLRVTTRHGTAVHNRLHVRIEDTESGSWAEYDAGGVRLRRVAEFDEAAS